VAGLALVWNFAPAGPALVWNFALAGLALVWNFVPTSRRNIVRL
jgi:hypothetical protein